MKIKFDPKNPLVYRFLIAIGALCLMVSLYQLGPYVVKRGIHFQPQEQVLGVRTENTSAVLRSAPVTPEITINEDGIPEITVYIEAEDTYIDNFEEFDFEKFKGVALHPHLDDNKVAKIMNGEGGNEFAARLLVETNPETYSEEGGNARVLGMRTEKRSTDSLIIGSIIFAILGLIAIRYRYKRSQRLLSLLLALSLIGGMSGSYTAYGQSLNAPLDFSDQNVQVRLGDVITYKIQYFNPDPSKKVSDVKFNFQIPKDTIYKLHSTKVELDDYDPLIHVLDGYPVTDAKDGDEVYFQNDRMIINLGDVPARTWGNIVIQVVAEGDSYTLAKTIMEHDGTQERLLTVKNPILKNDVDNDGINDFNDCDANNADSLFCDKFTGNDGIIIDDRADLLWIGEDKNGSNSSYLFTNKAAINTTESIRTKPHFTNNKDDYLHFEAKIYKGSLLALEDRKEQVGVGIHYDGVDLVTVESNNLKDDVEIKAANQSITAHIFVKNNESIVFIEDANGSVSQVGPYENDKFDINNEWYMYLDSANYTNATFDDISVTRETDAVVLSL
ncbi:hypothetical protein ACFL3C_03840 [Patescibacteria group bacterium]